MRRAARNLLEKLAAGFDTRFALLNRRVSYLTSKLASTLLQQPDQQRVLEAVAVVAGVVGVAVVHWGGRKEESSFSEEKEAKRLSFILVPGGCRHPGPNE